MSPKMGKISQREMSHEMFSPARCAKSKFHGWPVLSYFVC